jgi:GGDEF domain-containing protein
MVSDITALKVVENKLRVLARFDSLTGLPNRTQFDEKLTEALARSDRSDCPVTVMFLDRGTCKTEQTCGILKYEA